MERTHIYAATITWKGNLGRGTADYQGYSRAHELVIAEKPVLPLSSDASFRGDKTRHTPEDLLLSALSSCHMLWYLHLCATNKVIVLEYEDEAVGEMVENADGSGQFSRVTLQPCVTVSDASMAETAQSLHAEAHRMCFIARSVNFPVHHAPRVIAHEKA